MGTHPIFESDFDCLTALTMSSHSRSRSRSRSRSSRSNSRSYSRSRSRSKSNQGHEDGYDPAFKGYRVKVADLNTRINKYDLEKKFDQYGRVLDLILIRRCPTVCFIVYKSGKDAKYAAKKLHNLSIWNTRLRAELAKPSGKSFRHRGRSPPSRRRSRSRSRSRSRGTRRSRSRSRRRSPKRTSRRSRSRSKNRSRDSGSRSPKRREKSRSRSRSPRRRSRSRRQSRS